ncbi:hypothetical protein P879_02106 [Paragonimus westermani]|uniref:RFX-type winged-helix domain-containing protein n=1 Tax=Paragonimus westermani TaxID=34504 RepID=A0A8T0DVT4_9TREM|nr:hypothetical protein P879_02106 [Paragonimus westermani]
MLRADENDCGSNRNGFDYLKATLSASLSPEVRARIDSLVQEVAALKDIEKLLFCLLLPIDGGVGQHSFIGSSHGVLPDDSDIPGHGFELNTLGIGLFSPGTPSALHLSNQVEQSQAYTWIMSHLEEDPSTCLRKDEVYEDYRAYCDKHHMKTLNTADFGKVMKRAFPNVKPRRLGQRGQSRYCYGGMRKKTEVQPPFLPDLTDEALGLTTQGSVGRSTTSPASSSGASAENGSQRRRVLSISPLTRLLLTNGSDADAVSSADELAIRSVLGVRGVAVSDVAHILLEYAQQVFGVQFHSLFHLAQHLVTNRYVNSRSRYAFALIAYASNVSASLSPPPSTALAEAIQKGISKSAFDRVGNGRVKSVSTERSTFVKCEAEAPAGNDAARTPNRCLPAGVLGESSVPPTTPTTVNPLSGHPSLVSSHSPIVANSLRSFASGPVPSETSISHNPSCSTPHTAYRPYQPNFSPLPNHVPSTVGTNMYAAAAAFASQASTHSTSPYLFQTGRGPSANLRHSPAAVALAAAAAAAAAAARHQVGLVVPYPTSTTASGSATSLGSFANRISPTPTGAQFEVLTPPTAHKEKTSSFPTPSTPASNTSESIYPHVVNYLSPLTNPPMYTAHQQGSPYPGLQQPPAPLPPGVGARSPYTPMVNPSTGASDSTPNNFKRNAPLHPVDAPGAYEPSPRFHLGGQSPNKRARYLSTASGSSGTNSLTAECPPLSSSSGADNMESYGDPPGPVHTSVASASPASSASSGRSAQHPLATGYTSRADHIHPLGVGELQSASMPSPYYSGRYEGLEMRSPAPHHGHSGNHQLDRVTRLPSLTPSRDANLWGTTCISLDGSTMSVGQNNQPNQQNYNVSGAMSTSNTHVFRPPVTPFVLELDEEEDMANLPRLGTSPGPQIPPSSPTEFLPFYSEAASKSAQAKRQLCGSQTSKGHATPDSDDCGNSSSTESSKLSVSADRSELRSFVTPDNNLETPPSSALMVSSNRPLCSDGLVSPDSDSECSHDRTLTNFDNYGDVNTPPMPGGLANVPSPSDSPVANLLVRQREQMQNELSTPGPSEAARSPTLKTDSVSPPSHTGSADVSITAF